MEVKGEEMNQEELIFYGFGQLILFLIGYFLGKFSK